MRKCITLLLATVLAGCASFGGAAKGVVWPAVASCAGQVSGPLVDAVAVKVHDQDASGLDELAADAGADLVTCVLMQIIQGDTSARASMNRTVRMPSQDAVFADQFLSARGVHH